MCFFNCFCLFICFLLLESECLKVIRSIRKKKKCPILFWPKRDGSLVGLKLLSGSTSGPKECSSSEHQQIKLTEKRLLITNTRLRSAEVPSEEVCLVSEDEERRWTALQEAPLRAAQTCRDSQRRTEKWNESLLKISDSNKSGWLWFFNIYIRFPMTAATRTCSHLSLRLSWPNFVVIEELNKPDPSSELIRLLEQSQRGLAGSVQTTWSPGGGVGNSRRQGPVSCRFEMFQLI